MGLGKWIGKEAFSPAWPAPVAVGIPGHDTQVPSHLTTPISHFVQLSNPGVALKPFSLDN